MMRFLAELTVIAATAACLALFGEHKGLPDGLVYRGGRLLVVEPKGGTR